MPISPQETGREQRDKLTQSCLLKSDLLFTYVVLSWEIILLAAYKMKTSDFLTILLTRCDWEKFTVLLITDINFFLFSFFLLDHIQSF